MNSILFATDGSPSAQKALGEAIQLAKDTGALLRVLTVWQIPIITGFGYGPVACVPQQIEEEKHRARAVAEAAAQAASDAGLAATYEVVEGQPAAQICAFASQHDVQMIVLGAHGWGAFKRFLTGSVSTRVLHDAPCPVLVVRMQEHELLAHERERLAAVS